MRVSINESDIGFKPDWMNYLVYINDEQCDYCVTADEELGIAHIIKRDDSGMIIIKDDAVVMEEITGLIKIVKKQSIHHRIAAH